MTFSTAMPDAALWSRFLQSWLHRPAEDRLPDHIRAEAGLPPTVAWPVMLRVGVN